MTTGWTLFIVILTAINVVGAVWLLWVTSRRSPADKQPDAETTGHIWDGDLREYNNPLPRWWLWMFYGTVAFGIVYLVLYPGLGSWQGTAGWSQEKQWQEQVAAADAAAAPVYARFASMGLDELGKDPDAMRVARDAAERAPARELANGPGKLCQAFGITLDDYGTSLLRGRLTLRPRGPDEPRPELETSRRIGLGKGREHPYRFYVAGDPCVSRGRPG